jgi:arylsulfatase A-like enzyme
MSGARRTLAAVAVAVAWAAGITAVERGLATWAPPAVWWRVAGVNFGIALGVALALAWLVRRRPGLQFTTALLAAVGASLALVPLNLRGPGPVLWVVCDTLRADRMSLYGYRRPTSPFLEEWSQELVVFDEAYSQASHTLVTAPSILASLHPSTHGLRDYEAVLDPRATLVSEILQKAGFATFGAFANPNLRAQNGFAQGWDRFGSTSQRQWQHLSGASINRDFFRWRNQHEAGRPYFALLWWIDPHIPFQWDEEAADWAGLDPKKSFRYRPPVKDDSASGKIRVATHRRYDASVRSVDNALRDLVAFLRKQGDYDDALVLFTADHGESLWEHGRFGHNYGLYESLTHVPLAIRFPAPLRFPDFAPPPGRSQTIASSVDLLPTTLAFLGLPIGDDIQGRSLLPDLVKPSGGTAYLEERLTRYGPYHIFGLREGRYKYIWVEEFEGDHEPRAMLFDLTADPDEEHDLAAEMPELTADLHARVAALRRRYEALALETGTAEPDADARALLEKLGYIDEAGDEPPDAPTKP